MKITINQVRGLVDQLNRIAGENPNGYDMARPAGNRANVGTYVLDGSYGGWQLGRICNTAGGQSQPLGGGFESTRGIYEKISAFIRGLEAGGEVQSSVPKMYAALMKIAKEIEEVPLEYGLGGAALLGSISYICEEAIAHAEGRGELNQ